MSNWPYEAGDEHKIIQLANQVYPKLGLGYEDWYRRYACNPHGDGLNGIELEWDGATLAAHYAVSPVRLSVDGVPVETALSLLTMTHPVYRGRGLFPKLANVVYDRLDVPVWGFPNRLSHWTFVTKLGWHDVYEIPTLRASLPLPDGPKVYAEPLHVFDERFDVLWNRVRHRYRIAVQRDSEYLSWRYANEQYKTLVCIEGSELLGYVIFKRYGRDCQIMDLLAKQDEVSLGLIAAAARAMDTDTISLWVNTADSLHGHLERAGFYNDAPIFYFGVRPLGDLIFLDWRNWHITMGDNDVF